MFTTKVNEDFNFKLEIKNGNYFLDGNPLNADQLKIAEGKFHFIINNRSINAEIVSANIEDKTFSISVNGNKYQVQVRDQFDELLKNLGMDSLAAKKVNDVKSPMPGLVLKVLVNEGDSIKKGDALLLLEAMKMENVIKATGDGIIKKINVKVQDKVEKNFTLINMA